MRNYNIFDMKVQDNNGNVFNIAKTHDERVIVNIGDLFGLDLCDVDEFEYYCSKKAVDIRKGDLITFDGVELKVIDLDTETHEENIIAWEYAEMRDLQFFD